MRKREECFTTLQSGHLLYHSKSNNGDAGRSRFSHKQEMNILYSEGKRRQLKSSRTCYEHNKAL